MQNHEEWFQRTLSSKSLVDTIKIRLGAAGNSLLRAGTVIEIFVPKTGSIKGSDPEWYDRNVSGKYLITTLRHIITPEGYTNSMLLSKIHMKNQSLISLSSWGPVPQAVILF